MKRNTLTLVVGGILILIFAAMLFIYQVRTTEVAVVTTFGEYSNTITNAGPHFRWPWPIQKIHKFDTRIQNFDRKFEQTTTKDGRVIVMSVFVGWRIEDPETYLYSFNGDPVKAEEALEGRIRNTKNGVIGNHPFSDLISTNRAELKFDKIEEEMITLLRPSVREDYGVLVELLGIKQIQVPQSITETVFDRMRAERNRLVKKFQSEGEARAAEIRTEAELERQKILAEAEAESIVIQGEAEAQAAKAYSVFQKNPDLAVFLFTLRALDRSTKDRTTLILDQETIPFNMLRRSAVRLPEVVEQ